MVVLRYKLPKTMKRVPIRKMPQNFQAHFRWWYYDEVTGEAVIMLERGEKNWETIRVFEPMWLVNLSREDVYALYNQRFCMTSETWSMHCSS